MVWLLVEQQQGDVALNGHQQVVEVMRDTAGQGADGFHFLGLLNLGRHLLPLFFCLASIRDVFYDSQPIADGGGRIAQNGDAYRCPDGFAVPRHVAFFLTIGGGFPLANLLTEASGLCAVVGVRELQI